MANLRLNTSFPNSYVNILPPLFLHVYIQVKLIHSAHQEKIPPLCFNPQDDFCLESHNCSQTVLVTINFPAQRPKEVTKLYLLFVALAISVVKKAEVERGK